MPVLSQESWRFGLSAQSAGFGASRALCVLPRGMQPPEPSASTRRLAMQVYRWARELAEQEVDGAAPVPFSLGELIERIELDDGLVGNGAFELACGDGEGDMAIVSGHELEPPVLSASVTLLLTRARAVLATAPPTKVGEAAAQQTRIAYERLLALDGRLDAASKVVGGKAMLAKNKAKGPSEESPARTKAWKARHYGKQGGRLTQSGVHG